MVRRRNLIILASGIPVLALLALLGWSVARSGGVPGGVGVNEEFGEVPVGRRPAPEFSLETLDGGVLRLSDLRGKAVMVDFWSSWCPPCRQEAPALAQVYGEYADRGVQFVGIALWDKRDHVASHVERFGLTYPNGLDAKGLTAIEYGVFGLPEKFFIDSQGYLARKFVGPMEADKLRAALDGLLEP
jgi:cytochrome c biogenesis protein CcmG/thiol:disulfide interchange protein DsbE